MLIYQRVLFLSIPVFWVTYGHFWVTILFAGDQVGLPAMSQWNATDPQARLVSWDDRVLKWQMEIWFYGEKHME